MLALVTSDLPSDSWMKWEYRKISTKTKDPPNIGRSTEDPSMTLESQQNCIFSVRENKK